MKILVTGFNALTIGTARSPLNIATSARILPGVLKELGHEVTQKAIIPGEDVSQYDKVIVYVFGPNSLSARYWYGAAYTIIKRPDAIISIDDHQTKETVSGFGTFSRGHWRIWKKLSQAGNPVGKMYWDEAQPFKKEIEDLVDTFAFEEWPFKLLIPAYDGGNYEALGIKAKEITNWDPSPYTNSYLNDPKGKDLFTEQPVVKKEKAWMMASLLNKMNWLKKQTFTWPIKTFGNIKEGQTRLKEHELYQEYRKNWGILSPPHSHTLNGSGWYRARYNMAFDAGSILLGHENEIEVLGVGYRDLNINEIENKSEEELKNIVSYQRESFINNTWNKERTKEYFKCLLEEKS